MSNLLHDYIDDYDVIGWTREGDKDHPDSGIAVVLSDKRDGCKRMYIGRQFAGQCFRDCMRKVREVVTVDEEAMAFFRSKDSHRQYGSRKKRTSIW